MTTPTAIDQHREAGARVMTGQVLTFKDLRRLCSPDPDAPAPRASTVVRWAKDQGIPYKYDGRGGIWTTVAALNAALGISDGASEPHNTELI